MRNLSVFKIKKGIQGEIKKEFSLAKEFYARSPKFSSFLYLNLTFVTEVSYKNALVYNEEEQI